MRRYFRTTVTGKNKSTEVREMIVFQEGQDPMVLAFRRNSELIGMNSISMSPPEEAFIAGTVTGPEKAPTARELKRRAKDEAYRERINERLSKMGPREYARFGPGRFSNNG